MALGNSSLRTEAVRKIYGVKTWHWIAFILLKLVVLVLFFLTGWIWPLVVSLAASLFWWPVIIYYFVRE